MKEFLMVFIGGGVGSMVRYTISLMPLTRNGSQFPAATFLCNLLGCLLIGIFYAVSERFGWSPQTRLMLTTGLCGGFTTFSTFSNETLQLFRNGMPVIAIAYLILSLLLGIAMVFTGQWIATKA